MADVKTAWQHESSHLLQLERKHVELMNELTEHVSLFRRSTPDRDRFVDRANTFLNELGRYVPHAETTSASELIRRIATEWQLAFTTQLQVPQNVSQILQVRSLAVDREPMLADSSSARMQPAAVDTWIRKHASDISRRWKVKWATKLLEDLQQNSSVAHTITLRPPERTAEDDWCDACTYFAHEVLDARIDFALQLSVGSFSYLSDVWLQDVKKLKAYLIWERSQSAEREEDSGRNYYHACRDIHNQLMAPSIKAGPQSFAHIQDWLEREFLDDGKIAPEKQSCAAAIRRKANRCWQLTGSNDSAANWRRAEQYVRDFYENLIPAIVSSNHLAVASVLSAAGPCATTGAGCELVDSLEAALVIYFFDLKLMTEFFDGHQTYL